MQMTKRQMQLQSCGGDEANALNYLDQLPAELWHCILLECGIRWILCCVSHQWHALALHNSEQLLKEWLSRETTIPATTNDDTRMRARVHEMCDREPCWNMYRAVRRSVNIHRIICASDVPIGEPVPLSRVFLVHYSDYEQIYRVLPFRHYKHMLERSDLTELGTELATSKETLASNVRIRPLTRGPPGRIPYFTLARYLCRYNVRFKEGDRQHRIEDEDAYVRKARVSEAMFVAVPADWSMTTLLAHLNRLFNMASCSRQSEIQLIEMHAKHKNEAVEQWYAQGAIECEQYLVQHESPVQVLAEIRRSGVRKVSLGKSDNGESVVIGVVPYDFLESVPRVLLFARFNVNIDDPVIRSGDYPRILCVTQLAFVDTDDFIHTQLLLTHLKDHQTQWQRINGS